MVVKWWILAYALYGIAVFAQKDKEICLMALNIKNPYVESLLNEVAEITGESKTAVVRVALEERRHHLSLGQFGAGTDARIRMFLRDEVWPRVPAAQKGVRISKQEEEFILGYGEDGV